MIYELLFLGFGVLLMEISGWFIHKYVMHGILWTVHRTHHQPSKGPFELNDLFSLLFGMVSVVLMYRGYADLDYRFWIGLGISIYGFVYFLLHDMLIHRRIKWLNRPRVRIFRGIMRAHQAHHATDKRKGKGAYGLLIVPLKYLKEEKK